MTTNPCPRELFVAAWRLGCETLPEYSSFYSRKEFTLPQLFACLALRHFYGLSYRRTAALVAAVTEWREAIEMDSPPHHKTINDAFDTITGLRHPGTKPLETMFDHLTRKFEGAGLLKLDELPLSVDSTYFESHHVSRHYEKRKARTARDEEKQKQAKAGGRLAKEKSANTGDPVPDAQGSVKRSVKRSATRSATVRALPKIVLAVAASCHLILSCTTATGMSGDQNCLHDVLLDAFRRAPVKQVVADAGFDSEDNHELARQDLGIGCLIPPNSGRPTGKTPSTHFRAESAQSFKLHLFNHRDSYGQRWQSETVNSMMKRNGGSALRARTSQRREAEMTLRAVVHNLGLHSSTIHA